MVISSLSSGYYCCDETQNQLVEERAFVYISKQFIFNGQELKQDKNLKVGTDFQAMERCCLLACSTWLAQPDFLQQKDCQSRGDTTKHFHINH